MILDDHTSTDIESMIISLIVPSILSFKDDKELIDSLPVKEHVLLFLKSQTSDIPSRMLMDEVNKITSRFHGRLLFITLEESELSVVRSKSFILYKFFFFIINNTKNHSMQHFNMKPTDLPQVNLISFNFFLLFLI